ncbi:MAG: hypothetical protein RL181_1735, partial [Bacteroidota bacterium]
MEGALNCNPGLTTDVRELNIPRPPSMFVYTGVHWVLVMPVLAWERR